MCVCVCVCVCSFGIYFAPICPLFFQQLKQSPPLFTPHQPAPDARVPVLKFILFVLKQVTHSHIDTLLVFDLVPPSITSSPFLLLFSFFLYSFARILYISEYVKYFWISLFLHVCACVCMCVRLLCTSVPYSYVT